MRVRLAQSLVALLVLVLFGAAATKSAAPAVSLKVTTNSPGAIYDVNDDIVFHIKARHGDKAVSGEVTYTLNEDGVNPRGGGKLKLVDGAAEVHTKLDHPAILRCTVTLDKTVAMAGAAVAPGQIRPSLPVPDDFDAFWDAQKKKLAAVPMQPTLTKVASPDKTIETFDVQVTCAGGAPVSGYFARPIGAKPKSLPAILFVHGAGVRSSSLGAAVGGAKMGALGMDINAHGIPNGKPDAYYKELSEKELKDYRARGREDREQCYFLGMFLRLIRAIDFLTSCPEWDGKTVVVTGHSQGGGQSIAAAGLDRRVTFIAAGVPAICDHSGRAAGRINGWPKLVPEDAAGKPDAKILEVARYFDCMNMAARAKAEAIFSVGFIDTVCPATSVYATFNNYGAQRKMVWRPLMGHAAPEDIRAEFTKAIADHLKQQREAR